MKYENFIRTDEQKRLDLLELELMVKKYNYLAIRYFLKQEDYYSVERVMSIMDYFKLIDKLDKEGGKDRLKPSGELNGIMFVGINPSERSNLKNIWEDPFGKYFSKMLEEAGIDKSKIWMTNLYKKKTLGNRELDDKEIQYGMAELFVEVMYVNPKVIVTLGEQVKEHVIPDKFPGFKIVNLHHPAYIMRKNTPEIRSKYLSELSELKKYE